MIAVTWTGSDGTRNVYRSLGLYWLPIACLFSGWLLLAVYLAIYPSIMSQIGYGSPSPLLKSLLPVDIRRENAGIASSDIEIYCGAMLLCLVVIIVFAGAYFGMRQKINGELTHLRSLLKDSEVSGLSGLVKLYFFFTVIFPFDYYFNYSGLALAGRGLRSLGYVAERYSLHLNILSSYTWILGAFCFACISWSLRSLVRNRPN